MEKRIIAAFVLSFAILFGWSLFFKPKTTVQPVSNAVNTVVSKVNSPTVNEKIPLQAATTEEKTLTFENNDYKVIFNEESGSINNISFKKYSNYSFLLNNGLALLNENGFKLLKQSKEEIIFVKNDGKKEIVKRFIFSKPNYCIDLEVKVSNLTMSNLNFDLPVVLGSVITGSKKKQPNYDEFLVAKNDNSIFRPKIGKELIVENFKFLSVKERYFCSILQSASEANTGYVSKLSNNDSEFGIIWRISNLGPVKSISKTFVNYVGPQDSKILSAVNPQWTGVIYFGALDVIAQGLLKLLEIFYKVVHNWGIAIILLSICVYLILFPLSLKQMRSMKAMQVLQPKVEALRKTYSDNPQKLNKELLELYKEHKVNPMSGCLPLVLQMPIFFALYQALNRSVNLMGAKFLWIKDLSLPDQFQIATFKFNLLPILMAIGMFVQQKLSSSTSSGISNDQQKMMLILFPLLFGFIFYSMPSGLVLYWLINSILMLIFQSRIGKIK